MIKDNFCSGDIIQETLTRFEGVESLQRCDRRRAIRLFDLPNPSGMRQFEDPSGTSTLVAQEGAIFHVKKNFLERKNFMNY
jgi:hypothetical protein